MQIAFVTEDVWGVIDHNKVQTGLFSKFPLPEVDCPVVDLSEIGLSKAQRVIGEFVSPDGVTDVDKLIDKLVAAGATVRYPVGILVEAKHGKD